MSTEDKKANSGPAFKESGTAHVKDLFNVLLDISGILLGMYLVSVGTLALVRGYSLPIIWWILIWWSIILCGICAFLIHLFRYFGWNVRRFFGLR